MSEPVATLVINAYQQVRFAPLALRAALEQDCDPICIIASDDASTDGTFDALQAVAAGYDGPHQVTVRRNATNLGTAHLPTLLDLVNTPLVVIAHGDDVSKPNRVRRLVEEWRRTGASVIGSNADQVDEHGTPVGTYRTGPVGKIDATTLIGNGFRPEFLGATLAFERRLVEPPFGTPDQSQVFGGIDVILPIRGALLGGTAYVDEPLVTYRRHAAQQSWQITDATRDRAAFDEGLRAHNVPLRLQAIRDLQALRQAQPNRRDLPALQQLALEALFGEVQAWARLRVQLMGRGLRPSWITTDESLRRNQMRYSAPKPAR